MVQEACSSLHRNANAVSSRRTRRTRDGSSSSSPSRKAASPRCPFERPTRNSRSSLPRRRSRLGCRRRLLRRLPCRSLQASRARRAAWPLKHRERARRHLAKEPVRHPSDLAHPGREVRPRPNEWCRQALFIPTPFLFFPSPLSSTNIAPSVSILIYFRFRSLPSFVPSSLVNFFFQALSGHVCLPFQQRVQRSLDLRARKILLAAPQSARHSQCPDLREESPARVKARSIVLSTDLVTRRVSSSSSPFPKPTLDAATFHPFLGCLPRSNHADPHRHPAGPAEPSRQHAVRRPGAHPRQARRPDGPHRAPRSARVGGRHGRQAHRSIGNGRCTYFLFPSCSLAEEVKARLTLPGRVSSTSSLSRP